MIRVMTVDDHPLLREGLAGVINSQEDMSVVAEAGTGREAIDTYRLERPDVVLMDLVMPGMSGADAIARIREEDPAAKAIVLTTYDGDDDIYRALQAGARGYLLKDVYRQELIGAIRAVHEGRRCIPANVAMRLAERIPGTQLSPREHEVLALIVSGKTNRDIAAALQIAEGTVKTHVNVILSKLGAKDRAQAMSIALQRGIVHL